MKFMQTVAYNDHQTKLSCPINLYKGTTELRKCPTDAH